MLSSLPQPAQPPPRGRGARRDAGKWFCFFVKFIEKGYEWGDRWGEAAARTPAGYQQSLAPGWEGGTDPQLWSPHPSQNSGWARPPERHCRPAHAHTGTQGHSVTTMLKLRGGREEREKKKRFSSVCLLLGTLGTQVGACARGRGRLALKESSRGAGGYRAGDIHRDYVQRRGCPRLSPQ